MTSTTEDSAADVSGGKRSDLLARLFALYCGNEWERALRYARTVRPEEACVEFLNLTGVCAKRCGDRSAAEAYYRMAIDRDAACTSARNNLAILLQETGRSEEAENLYLETLRRAPADALLHLNLGNLYLASKRYALADQHYRTALALDPNRVEALRYGAEAMIETGRSGEAEALLNHAVQRYPKAVDVLIRLANLACDDKRPEQALAWCRQALSAAPKSADQLTRIAAMFQSLKHPQQAEAAYRRALAIEPDNPNTLNDLGILMQDAGRFAESEACYRRALTLQPTSAEGWNNFAVLAQKQKRFDEAEAAYINALTHRPDYAAARCNYGLLCLTLGRFEEGWPLYEARYAPDRSVPFPKLSKPQWRGEPLAGKSILIWNEQGMGDEIQFARFAKTLKAQGAKRVGLVCKRPLVSLMRTLEGVDALHVEGETFSIGPYDYWTFPLSIPRYCCASPADIPKALAYLRADPALQQHWAPRLNAKGRRVGLVWKGRAEYPNDANRSLPSLKTLAPLWSVPNTHFFSLQKGEAEDEAAAPPPGQPLVALGPALRDFADTAAVVTQLDLVICADTAIAHLCGALGVTCWVLLPYVGTDWRWMLGRSDSPWYPSLRVFRQPAPGDWGSVIAEVTAALNRLGDSAIGTRRAVMDAVSGTQSEAKSFAHWVKVANDLHLAGELTAANTAYQQALRLNDKARGVWHNYGALCRAQNHFDSARQAYRRAIQAEGPYPEGYYNLGNLHEAMQNDSQAEACYRQAIALKADYAQAWYNLGVILMRQGRLTESEQALRHAIALRSDYHEAHINLGMVLQSQGDNSLTEAERAFRQAIDISPLAAEAHNNLGVVLQLQHCFDEAAEAFEQAIQLRPDFPNARWNLSLMHLVRGDFTAAWPLFPARTGITHRQSHPPDLPFPQWQGEDLQGKRILIWPEQGLGDEIQFCRYAPMLKQRGAAGVTLACKPALQRLFRTIEGVDDCIPLTEGKYPFMPHDFWVFTMSLPALFQTTLTTIPAALPYLYPDDDDLHRFQRIFPKQAGKRVGVVWRGSPLHPNDRYRSLPGAEVLSPLFALPGIHFASIQVDDHTDAACPSLVDIPRAGERFKDFADTAAAICQLDLVISVDTATAHLAGALGKPTWVLLPFRGLDWRWLRHGSESPWYPGVMRLFRQEARESWHDVVDRVRDALIAWRDGA